MTISQLAVSLGFMYRRKEKELPSMNKISTGMYNEIRSLTVNKYLTRLVARLEGSLVSKFARIDKQYYTCFISTTGTLKWLTASPVDILHITDSIENGRSWMRTPHNGMYLEFPTDKLNHRISRNFCVNTEEVYERYGEEGHDDGGSSYKGFSMKYVMTLKDGIEELPYEPSGKRLDRKGANDIMMERLEKEFIRQWKKAEQESLANKQSMNLPLNPLPLTIPAGCYALVLMHHSRKHQDMGYDAIADESMDKVLSLKDEIYNGIYPDNQKTS